MKDSSIQCALLATLVARHRSGTPIETETLLGLAAVESHEYVEAREVLGRLQRTSYVTDHGFRGVELDDSSFGSLADALREECGWDPNEVEIRLSHCKG